MDDATVTTPLILRDRYVTMFCFECEAEYSANPSDYFWAHDGTEFTCCNGAPMVLVERFRSDPEALGAILGSATIENMREHYVSQFED